MAMRGRDETLIKGARRDVKPKRRSRRSDSEAGMSERAMSSESDTESASQDGWDIGQLWGKGVWSAHRSLNDRRYGAPFACRNSTAVSTTRR